MAQAGDDKTEAPETADRSTPETADSAEAKEPGPDPVRRWTLVTLAVIGALLAWYIAADRFTPFSSQARVDAYVVPIAPQVQGNVLTIGVSNNRRVEAGDLLVQLDDSQYRLAVNKARADVEAAEQAFGAADAAVDSAAAGVKAAQAELVRAEKDYNRQQRIRW